MPGPHTCVPQILRLQYTRTQSHVGLRSRENPLWLLTGRRRSPRSSGGDGEQLQIDEASLTHPCPPPLHRPPGQRQSMASLQQATDRHWSTAQGLGTLFQKDTRQLQRHSSGWQGKEGKVSAHLCSGAVQAGSRGFVVISGCEQVPEREQVHCRASAHQDTWNDPAQQVWGL